MKTGRVGGRGMGNNNVLEGRVGCLRKLRAAKTDALTGDIERFRWPVSETKCTEKRWKANFKYNATSLMKLAFLRI